MELNQAISGRRAVRDYTADPLDEPIITRLITAAQQAPSAMNGQPWAYAVVRDQAVLDKASDAAKAHMLATLPADAHPHGTSHLTDDRYQIFYHAPALVLISAATEGVWNVEDCALAAQNLMLAAFAEGLGSCWIGFAQGYFGTAEGKAALGLPVAWVPVAPIILGHPKAAAPAVQRRAPEILWVN